MIKRERIQRIQRNLEDLERRYKEGTVEEKDYQVMKRDAKKRIAEIKAKK